MTTPLDTTELELALTGYAFHHPEILDDLRVPLDELSSIRAATIIAAQRAIHERGDAVNTVTVRNELESTGKLAQAGGDEMLLETSARYDLVGPRELARLHELSACRRAKAGLTRALEQCKTGVLEAVRAELDEVDLDGDAYVVDDVVTLAEAARATMHEVIARNEDPSRNPTISLGLPSLQYALGGLEPGDMLVIGAPTSVGKSSLALEMAVAQQPATPSGVVTCEDGAALWGQRYQARFSKVSSLRMRQQLTRDELQALRVTVMQMRDTPIYLAPCVGKSEQEVLAAMRKLVRQRGAKILYVDYVQTIKPSNRQRERRDQVREMANNFKGQAAALGVPLVLISQLKRLDENREPSKHDLKETGDLENAAEAIALLWLDAEVEGRINVKIDKGKWGVRRKLFALRRNPEGLLVDDFVPPREQPAQEELYG